MKNALSMAYLGDTIYEFYVRKHLIDKGLTKVGELQKESLNYVSARSQRRHIESLMDKNFLTDEEIELYKWGRNTNVGKSKSTDIITYRIATGFETLIGSLHMQNKKDRIEEIMKEVLNS